MPKTIQTSLTVIERKIFLIRGQKVMLDKDLAGLYGVETGVLNQAVKRNHVRFPKDFMFQLTESEKENWISQIVISNSERMGIRRPPYAFTENGVAMLSSVLRSPRAIRVNIQIMRAFTQLRKMLAANKELASKLLELEGKTAKHDREIQAIFEAIRRLMTLEAKKEHWVTSELRKTQGVTV